MRTTTPRGVLAATVIALALVVAACSSDSGSDSKANDDKATTTTEASDTTPGDPDTSLPTGEEICTKVASDAVSTAAGVEVTKATPSDPSADVPPTCTYTYADGAVTVSVLRPLDMNGKAGSEGYKAFVEINKGLAEGATFDEVPVEVGRESVRFTGSTTHAMISDTGSQVVQVVVPKAGVSGDQADALLVAVVDAIG